MKKDEILSEKIKTALISTFKVISLKLNKDKLEDFDKKTKDLISQNNEIILKPYLISDSSLYEKNNSCSTDSKGSKV